MASGASWLLEHLTSPHWPWTLSRWRLEQTFDLKKKNKSPTLCYTLASWLVEENFKNPKFLAKC